MNRRKRWLVLGLLASPVVAAFVLSPVGGDTAEAVPHVERALLLDEVPVVDNFNRADEAPLGWNGTWDTAFGNPQKIVSGQVACGWKSPTCDGWWKVARYGLDQEAVVTIAVKPGNGKSVRLYARLQKPTVNDGYMLLYDDIEGIDRVSLYRIENGATAFLGTSNQEFLAGDKLRIRAIGPTISAYRGLSGGGWQLLTQAIDPNPYLAVGYVGMGVMGTTGRIDDFGAQTLREPPPDSAPRPLVDDFNRPNETLWFGNWDDVALYPLKILSHQVACGWSSAVCSSWRKDRRYGLDQEASVTIDTKPRVGDWVNVYARLQKPTLFDGYVVAVQTAAGADKVIIARIDGGVTTHLQTTPETISQEFVHGDGLMIRAVGPTIEAWRRDNNTGAWTKLGHASDATYLGIGYVGIGLRGTGGRLDDFRAASLREPVADASPAIDDFNRPNEGLEYGNWDEVAGYQLNIVSHQVACGWSSATCASWRKDVRYGLDQEASATIEVKPKIGHWVNVYARLQQPTAFDGYVVAVQTAAGADNVIIARIAGGVTTHLQTISKEFLQGDRVKIRAVGPTIEAWRYDNYMAYWTKLGEATDPNHFGAGYLGLGIHANDGRLDNFRGGDSPSSGVTPEESDALLARYVPELRFPRDETYRADSAGLATSLYFDDPSDNHTNFLRRPGVPDPIAAADPTPATGPFSPLTLDYLNTSAQAGDYLSQPTFIPDEPILSARIDYSQWVSGNPGYQHYVYGRVVPDPAGTGAKIVQYWMYYYYNPKNTAGIGKHEGDWEWAQIRLSPSGVPQMLSYSQHGHPENCSWGDYPTQYTPTDHPIVYVAIESHANYFWQGNHPYNFDGLANGVDNTWDDGAEFHVAPSVVNVTNDPPRWISAWDGYWGDSFGEVKSPKSPGFQFSWNDPWGWESEPQAVSCTEPVVPLARRLRSGEEVRQPVTEDAPAPALPKIIRAHVVRGTKYGTAVRVAYCFASLPKDPWRRPSRLQLTVENLRDNLPPLGHPWPVTKRCASVTHPVGGIRPPYLLRYSVQSKRGTWSRRSQIRIRG